MAESPWTLHPILAPGDTIKPNLWYCPWQATDALTWANVVVNEHFRYIIPTDEDDKQQVGPRLGLSCVNLAEDIVFFGGATPAGLFNDVCHLDKGWSCVLSLSGPPLLATRARSKLSMVQVNVFKRTKQPL